MKAFYPSHAGLAGIAELDPETYVSEELMADLDGLMWIGVVASTLAFVCLPFWTVWRPLPSFLLSQQALDRHSSNMANSDVYPIRNAAMLVKMVAGFHWARHQRVRSAWALEPYPEDPDTWRTV